MAVTAKLPYLYEPDYAVRPGETLQETIDSLGMTQRELAVRTGLTTKTINRIIKGVDAISHHSAIKLERATGVPAHMWNNLEMNYREALARLDDAKRLQDSLEWLRQIPTKALLKWGAIHPQPDKLSLLREVLAFFGVDSPQEWEQLWRARLVSFRKSERFETRLGAAAVWLRWGERKAQDIDCAPFDRAAFMAALEQVRGLTAEPPELFQPESVNACAEAGVAVAFVPQVQGCPAWGAAQWLTPKKALLQVSLRYKSNDHLWFTFFHEAGHILNDGKRDFIVDTDQVSGESEERADRFAADLLIPPERAEKLSTLKARRDITRFSKSVGIAPGIVVGRMQKEGLIPYSHHNDLKRRLKWQTK